MIPAPHADLAPDDTGSLWRARYELLREAHARGAMSYEELGVALYRLGFEGANLERELAHLTHEARTCT